MSARQTTSDTPTRPEPPAGRSIVAPTLTDLIHELAAVIDECIEHGNCFFIVEAPDQHRYVQGLIRNGGTLWLESVSDESLNHCCEEHCLTVEQIRTLVHLGWRTPAEDAPNWHRELDASRAPARLAAELLARTLSGAHGVPPAARLGVSTGEALGPPCRVAVV